MSDKYQNVEFSSIYHQTKIETNQFAKTSDCMPTLKIFDTASKTGVISLDYKCLTQK